MTDTTPAAPPPGSPEYNQHMADKFRNQGSDATPPDELPPSVVPMPEGGLEKFYNKETGVYDWPNHVKELNYRLDQTKGDKSEEPPAETPPEDQTQDQEVTDLIQRAGLKEEDLEQSIRTTGSLPEGAREALIKQGIPASMIDAHVELYKQSVETNQNRAFEYIGDGNAEAGQKLWGEIHKFAQTLPEEEKLRFNRLLGSEDWQSAVDVLKARMAKGRPTNGEGQLFIGEGGGPTTPVGYRTRDEMKADMRNPRYQTDAEFRRQVMEKRRHARFIDGQF